MKSGGFGLSIRSRKRRRDNVVLHHHLQLLRDARREGATRLHGAQLFRRHRSLGERGSQDVRRRHGVLNRQVDADAADAATWRAPHRR